MSKTFFNRLMVTLLVATMFFQGAVQLVFANEEEEGTPVTVSGELTVLYEDDLENHKAKLIYELKDEKNNKYYKLKFKGQERRNLKSGMKITARGKAKGKELILAQDDPSAESIEISAQVSEVVPEAAGEQKTLVIVGDFVDAEVSCSVSDIDDIVFSDPQGQSVDALYQETSFGQTWLSGQVVGPYPLNFTNDSCDISPWADAADAAARADGIDVDSYARIVYVLPPGTCRGAGYGSVLGSPTRAWILRCDFKDTYAHELGHNMGMAHAATPTAEYGDLTDFMGTGNNKLRQVNAPHKDQMGWLPSYQIETLTASGVYEVAPLELDPADTLAPQTLKIAKPDTNESYYLSYRRAIGFDDNLSSISQLDRLAIHRFAADASGGKTYLLAQLADGESYTDSVNDITITAVSHDETSLTAQVSMGPVQCTPRAPALSFSPASLSGQAGDTLNYTVSVTNMDTAACGDSTFSLDRSLPAGWSGTVSPSILNLAPGQTGSATLSVTSSSTAAGGTYAATVNVSDSSESAHTASSSASYVVLSSCSPVAPTVTLSPSGQSGSAGDSLSYTVSVTNHDATSCGSSSFSLDQTVPLGWGGDLSQTAMTLSPGQSGSAILTVTSPLSAGAGTYTAQVDVSDYSETAHSGSTTASYTVTVDSDTQAPTAPANLSATIKGKQVKLSWGASVDNVGVAKYAIWRDGVHLGDTTATSYGDSSVPSGTTCSYFIIAYDQAGNASPASNTATVTMGGGGSKGGGKGNGKNK